MNHHLKNLKYNKLVVGLYNFYLNIRIKNTEAFIFVATTGRSGSQSLSEIFGIQKKAICFHEPYPIMIADDFREESPEEVFLKKKRINIKRSAIGYKYYVETNHQFIKHFAELAIREFGKRIRILHLYRDPLNMAKSFFAINSIPGMSRNGINYLLDPFATGNIISFPAILAEEPGLNHPFVRCLWYWYETEARIHRLKEKYPDVIMVDIRTEDLNNPAMLEKMIRSLKLTESFDVNRVAGTRLNLKKELKKNQIADEEALAYYEKFKEILFTKVDNNLASYFRKIESPVFS
jgi:hypothetical protein